MKIIVLVGIMAFSCALSAFAVNPAVQEDIEAIRKQIFFANKMDKEVKAAALKVSLAKVAKESEDKILVLEKELAREKNKQSAARTVAIHMTIEAYGLEPASRSGTSVMPLTKGRTITWQPVAREAEARQIQNAKGDFQNQPQPTKDLVGKVYTDGVAYIYPGAFEKGVGYLASTLLHERIHFEQITTPDKGNKMRRAESEVEAYQAEKDNELNFFNPEIQADKDEMAETAQRLSTETLEAEQVKKERATLSGRLRDLLPHSAPPDMFESKVHTNAELADISALVAQARAQADIARRDREEREANAKAAAEEAARRDRGERLKYAYVNLARKYCANPESVSQEELDALRESDRPAVPDTLPDAPTGCSGPLYFSLLHGASAEAIRKELTPKRAADLAPPRQVAPATPEPPTPFENVLPELSAFAAQACRAPETVSIGDFQAQISRDYFNYDYSYMARDADIAAGLSSRFDECAKALFRRLIDMHRGRQYRELLSIDRQWIRSFVAANSSVPDSSPGYTPGGRGPRCEDFGNQRCP